MASLDGIWAKIDRSREHLEGLDQGTQAFMKRNPYTYTIQEDLKTGRNIVRIIGERAPTRLSIIAGEAIQAMRSSLDYLVCQLVLLEGKAPNRGNYFPICLDEGDFIRDVRDRPANRGPGPLHGLDRNGTAWDLIEKAQPYRRRYPKEYVLAVLAELSNADKHRSLFTHSMLIEGWQTLIHWSHDAILLEQEMVYKPGMPFEHNTEIARFIFDPSGPEPGVTMQGNFSVRIAFGNNESRQWPIGSLDWMRVKVIELVREFEPLFTKP